MLTNRILFLRNGDNSISGVNMQREILSDKLCTMARD